MTDRASSRYPRRKAVGKPRIPSAVFAIETGYKPTIKSVRRNPRQASKPSLTLLKALIMTGLQNVAFTGKSLSSSKSRSGIDSSTLLAEWVGLGWMSI